MKTPTFESFLQDKHGDQYIGLDDDMPDDYENWLMNLDIQEVIDWAEEWHKKLQQEGQAV